MTEYQGMRWFKCDLQVHTPEDGKHWDHDDPLKLSHPRRPRINGKADEDDIREKAKSYLRRCYELALGVIAVTDHNFSRYEQPRDWFLTHLIEQNKSVADEYNQEPLWIFPGFEIDIGYHLLCLFEPVKDDKHLVKITESLTKLGLPPDQRFQDGCPCLLRHDGQNVSLRTVLKIVQDEYGGIVVAPHAFSDNGIADDSANKEDYKNEALLCVEVKRYPLQEPEKSILTGANPIWRRPNRQPAYIMLSDGKSTRKDENESLKPNSLGCRFSWIKMSKPSIEALRQAFLDHQSRIRLQKSSPDQDYPHGRIVSFGIDKVAFLENQKISFSTNLNCLIGGRGTGKSTVLEYLRMAIRQDDVELAKKAVERIRGTLQHDSVLTLEWSGVDGVYDRFEFRPELVKAQVIGREVSDPATIFKNLDIQVFSQRQISELAQLDEHNQPSFLLPLIDRLCGEELARLKQQELELIDKISQVMQQQRILQRLEQERREIEQELTELTRQWNARAAVQEESTRHRHAQDADRYLKRLHEEAEQIHSQWNGLVDDLVQAHSPVGSVVRNWPVREYFERLDVEIEKTKNLLAQDVRDALEKYQSHIRELMEANKEWPPVQQAIKQAEQDFLQACERQGLQPKDVERLREIDAQRRIKNVEAEQKKSEIQRVQKTVKDLNIMLDELHGLWRLQWQTRMKIIEELLASDGIRKIPRLEEKPVDAKRPFIEVIIKYFADLSHFFTLWNHLAPDGRTRLGIQWEEIGKNIFDSFTGVTEPIPSPWFLLESWFCNPEATPNSLKSYIQEIKKHLQNSKTGLWDRTRLTRVKDGVDLILYRGDGSVAGSLQKRGLSDGQRNTAVLSLLLAKGTGPILFDQPEDELDSDFIFKELVPLLRHIKERRQIILITHNANLPVNGDAEFVYALEAKDGRGRIRTQGGLDREDVKQAILDIMEGSEEAFRKRREKYHF